MVERLLLLCAALLCDAAHAEPGPPPRAQVEAYLHGGLGLRQTGDSGLLLGGGAGLRVGYGGLEYEVTWTNDHTFSEPDLRTAARTTHWLAGLGWLPVHPRVALALSVGPGLGWVKPPGDAERVGGRQLAWGLREQLRAEVDLSQHDLLLALGLRLGAEHHFQDAVTTPVEHAFTGSVYLRLGLRAW